MVKGIVQFLTALMIMIVSKIEISVADSKQIAGKILAGDLMLKDFLADPTAEGSPKAIVGLVVALTVGLIVIGYLFPVGMTAFHAINFSAAGMTTDEIAIYGVLGIFAIICLLLAMIGVAISVYEK